MIVLVGGDGDFGTDDDAAFTGLKGFMDAAFTLDDASGRKVRTFDDL